MTNAEYTQKLGKVLDMFLEWNKPMDRPTTTFSLDDSMSKSEAITAIQQLNNKAIGEDEPTGETAAQVYRNDFRQELRNIMGREV